MPGPITTYYIVDGDADIKSHSRLCNIAIIADKITTGGEVTLDSVALIAKDPDQGIFISADFNMNNILLAARGNVELQSNGFLGDPDTCNGDAPSVQIFAAGNLSIGSTPTIYNGDLVAGVNFSMGSDPQVNMAGNGTTIQALNNIWIASYGTFGACPDETIAEEEEDPVIISGTRRIVW